MNEHGPESSGEESGGYLLESVLEQLPLGVVVFDGHGEIAYRNRAIVDLMGGEIAWRKNRLRHYASAGGSGRLMTIFIPQKRVLLIKGSQLGEMQMITAEDVTKQNEWEESRRSFVLNASHELKGPAAAILAISETLEGMGGLPGAAARFSQRLKVEAQRLTTLVLDLLDLSRLEQKPALTEQVDLRELITELAGYWTESAEKSGVRLEMELCPECPPVTGDPEDIRLMVSNLLDNAIRYNREGGKVELALACSGREALLTISDTGIGIPGKHLPYVFERFYRVDSSRSRDTGGTGIGLSIVKHIAESHNGRVEVKSSLGEGSEFLVILPVP